VRAYHAREPYVVAPHTQRATRDLHFILVDIREQPDFLKWSAMACDVLQNLHVALDLLWNDVHPPTTGQGGGFPYVNTEEQFKQQFLNPARPPSYPPGALDILTQLKPYENHWDSLIWLIIQLDNRAKHETLPLVHHEAAVIEDLIRSGISIGRRGGPPLEFSWAIPTVAFKAVYPGALLKIVPVSRIGMMVDLDLGVAIKDHRCPRAVPVPRLLTLMVEHVDAAVAKFADAGLLTNESNPQPEERGEGPWPLECCPEKVRV
jgi:hypothetical protein